MCILDLPKLMNNIDILYRAMGMAVKDMAQDNSMVPHLPVRPVHLVVVVVVVGANRVAGVDQVRRSGAATMASSHGVDLVTVPAVARGGKLMCTCDPLFLKMCEASGHYLST